MEYNQRNSTIRKTLAGREMPRFRSDGALGREDPQLRRQVVPAARSVGGSVATWIGAAVDPCTGARAGKGGFTPEREPSRVPPRALDARSARHRCGALLESAAVETSRPLASRRQAPQVVRSWRPHLAFRHFRRVEGSTSAFRPPPPPRGRVASARPVHGVVHTGGLVRSVRHS